MMRTRVEEFPAPFLYSKQSVFFWLGWTG